MTKNLNDIDEMPLFLISIFFIMMTFTFMETEKMLLSLIFFVLWLITIGLLYYVSTHTNIDWSHLIKTSEKLTNDLEDRVNEISPENKEKFL